MDVGLKLNTLFVYEHTKDYIMCSTQLRSLSDHNGECSIMKNYYEGKSEKCLIHTLSMVYKLILGTFRLFITMYCDFFSTDNPRTY